MINSPKISCIISKFLPFSKYRLTNKIYYSEFKLLNKMEIYFIGGMKK